MRHVPKAGKYDLPYFDLDSLIDKLKIAHDKLRSDEMDRAIVAETLGMSAKGGGYTYIISDMEKYGLIETGRGKIVITPLGKEAIYGAEAESKKAKEKAVSNISLFKEIYLQYGINVTEEQVRAFLRQTAGVDIVKVQPVALNALKIYRKISHYFEETDFINKNQAEQEYKPPKVELMPSTSKERDTNYLKIQFGEVLIQIPQNDLNAIALAKNALEIMENYLRSQQKNG